MNGPSLSSQLSNPLEVAYLNLLCPVQASNNNKPFSGDVVEECECTGHGRKRNRWVFRCIFLLFLARRRKRHIIRVSQSQLTSVSARPSDAISLSRD